MQDSLSCKHHFHFRKHRRGRKTWPKVFHRIVKFGNNINIWLKNLPYFGNLIAHFICCKIWCSTPQFFGLFFSFLEHKKVSQIHLCLLLYDFGNAATKCHCLNGIERGACSCSHSKGKIIGNLKNNSNVLLYIYITFSHQNRFPLDY